MILLISQQDHILQSFGKQIVLIGAGGAHKALARAVNRTTDSVEARSARAIAKQSSIKLGTVKRSLKKQLVKPGSFQALEGKVIATGRPISLKEFGAKQFKFGVRAKVWGRVQRFPGTFIFAGTFKSGKPVGNGHVFHRTTIKSLPIEKLWGPAVPEEMVKGEAKKAFETTVSTMLPVRVAYEVGRILPQ